MTLSIKELEERPDLRLGDIEDFLANRSFPLVEGSSITFVFRGQVQQVALRHWIQGLPSEQALERIAGTDLWFLVVDLPAGWSTSSRSQTAGAHG